MYYDVAYAPYGEKYSDTGTQVLNFTGQNQDTASFTYDFLSREYNPNSSRWTQSDPAGLSAVNIANPQSWNRYIYVFNEPLNNVDPLGLRKDAGSPDSCRGDNCGFTYVLDGMVIPALLAQRLLYANVAAICPNGNCNNIRQDPENDQWEELVGWQRRTALTPTGGNWYRTWSPIWIDYSPLSQVQAQISLTPVTTKRVSDGDLLKPKPLSGWDKFGMTMGCLAGGDPEYAKPITLESDNSRNPDSTDDPSGTHGQDPPSGLNKRGRPVQYGGGSPEGPNGVADGAALASSITQCITNVFTAWPKK